MSTPVIDLELRHAFATGFRLDARARTSSPRLALFGPSGSGKSTVLEAVAGLVRPQAGHVRVRGRTLLDRTAGVELPARHRRVGLVLQDGLLFPSRTVRGNLLFGASRPASSSRGPSLEEAARLLEIEHLLDRWPRSLSGGERQRVALGRAVLSGPELLLCDEPFAALDEARRSRLVRTLARLLDELRIPLLLVSHDVREVLALADHVVVLEEGAVRREGPPELLLSAEEPADLNYWEAVVERREEPPEDGLWTVRAGEARLHVPLPDPGVAPGQRVRLALDARHVALHRHDDGEGSARNHLAARAVSVTERPEGLLRVALDAGLPLVADVTHQAAQELDLRVGAQLVARFKASAVRLLALRRPAEAS